MDDNPSLYLFYFDDRKLRKSFIQFPFFLFLLLSVPLRADIVSDLYQAKVEVSNQSNRAQEKAIQDALEQVLIKVSGSKHLLKDKAVREKVKQAGRYLRQYQFESDAESLLFVAEFDAEKVDDLLRELSLPIWGSYRPSTILWLAEENESLQRQLYSEYTNEPLKHAILNESKQRGLSLVFPVADITETASATIYDVWGQFSSNIQTASERYDVEIVMSARVYPKQELAVEFEEPVNPFENEAEVIWDWIGKEDIAESIKKEAQSEAERLAAQEQQKQRELGTQKPDENEPKEEGWLADWMLMVDGKIETGQVEALEKELLSALLVDMLADKLAAKYAVKTHELEEGEAKATRVTLVNLDSIEAYVRAKSYFESLQAVSSVQLVSLNSQRAEFNVALIGRENDLINALQLDDKVRRITDAFGRPTAQLEFIWSP